MAEMGSKTAVLSASRPTAAIPPNGEGVPTPPEVIKHISPLSWQHISLTGDYIWTPTDGVNLRPLRRETSILAA